MDLYGVRLGARSNNCRAPNLLLCLLYGPLRPHAPSLLIELTGLLLHVLDLRVCRVGCLCGFGNISPLHPLEGEHVACAVNLG